MKFSLFALLTAALSVFPSEAPASVPSHLRCGVMAGYHISIPLEYQNVRAEIDHANVIEICSSPINRITFSVQGDNVRPVSTGGWLKNDQKSYSVIVEPREQNAASSADEIIRTLYDKSSYHNKGGYPSKPPQKIGGLTYIQGTPLAGEVMRDDFYLSSDRDGHLEYLIHCSVIGSRENGQCIIGYKPKGIDLSLIVGISAEDVGSYQDISDKALEFVESMIIGRVLG